MAIRDGDDNINNLFTFCECRVTATCTVCMQFKIEFHFSVFFCLSKFIAGNFRVLVEVLNRKKKLLCSRYGKYAWICSKLGRF